MDPLSTGTSSSEPAQPGNKPKPANDKLQQTQNQVNEVLDIMTQNVEKIIERGDRIQELDERANNLRDGSTGFQQQSRRLRRNMWWQNFKWNIILGVVGIVILVGFVWWLAK
uniref:Synaptobrevin n=1 Tax=Cacopsylla melanoneura TaxID=428564 RepID=A0A8D8PRS1_9HEMI